MSATTLFILAGVSAALAVLCLTVMMNASNDTLGAISFFGMFTFAIVTVIFCLASAIENKSEKDHRNAQQHVQSQAKFASICHHAKPHTFKTSDGKQYVLCGESPLVHPVR